MGNLNDNILDAKDWYRCRDSTWKYTSRSWNNIASVEPNELFEPKWNFQMNAADYFLVWDINIICDGTPYPTVTPSQNPTRSPSNPTKTPSVSPSTPPTTQNYAEADEYEAADGEMKETDVALNENANDAQPNSINLLNIGNMALLFGGVCICIFVCTIYVSMMKKKRIRQQKNVSIMQTTSTNVHNDGTVGDEVEGDEIDPLHTGKMTTDEVPRQLSPNISNSDSEPSEKAQYAKQKELAVIAHQKPRKTFVIAGDSDDEMDNTETNGNFKGKEVQYATPGYTEDKNAENPKLQVVSESEEKNDGKKVDDDKEEDGDYIDEELNNIKPIKPVQAKKAHYYNQSESLSDMYAKNAHDIILEFEAAKTPTTKGDHLTAGDV